MRIEIVWIVELDCSSRWAVLIAGLREGKKSSNACLPAQVLLDSMLGQDIAIILFGSATEAFVIMTHVTAFHIKWRWVSKPVLLRRLPVTLGQRD